MLAFILINLPYLPAPKDEITKNAVKDMVFHYKMLEAMGVEDHSYINIHVGGAYGDKETATAQFHENLKQLPSENQSANDVRK